MAVLIGSKFCVGTRQGLWTIYIEKKIYFENAQIRIENPSKFENDRRLAEQQLKLNLFTGSLVMKTTSGKTNTNILYRLKGLSAAAGTD